MCKQYYTEERSEKNSPKNNYLDIMKTNDFN